MQNILSTYQENALLTLTFIPRRIRSFSLILLIALTSLSLYGQSEKPALVRHLIGRAGICLPTGDFSATNIHATDGLGYASMGYSLGVEFTSEVVKGFQFALAGGYSVNGVDDATLQKDFDKTVGANVTVKAGSYSAVDFLVGIGFLTDISPDVALHGMVHAGALMATFPDITIAYLGNESIQNSADATVVQYGASFGMTIVSRYDLNVRYLTAEPEFTIGNGSSGNKTKQSMGRIEATVGFVFF